MTDREEKLRAKAREIVAHHLSPHSADMVDVILAALRDAADERERDVRTQVERDMVAAFDRLDPTMGALMRAALYDLYQARER